MNTYIGIVTGKGFQDKYNEMEEQGLNPKASTVIPVTESNAGPDARFHVWIFHNAPIKSKPLAMDM